MIPPNATILSEYREPGVTTTVYHVPRRTHHGRRHEDSRPKGVDNLRAYLRTTEIPSIARGDKKNRYSLPVKGFSSRKNKLKVQYDEDRHISRIKWYARKSFENAAKRFNNNFVYGEEGRPFVGKLYSQRRAGEALCLNSREFRAECGFPNTVYPTNISGTCEWLLTRSFKTLQRAIHLAFPYTLRWWLEEAPNTDPRNDALWRTYLWKFHPDEYQKVWWRDVFPDIHDGTSTEPASNNSMAFIVQSPWILSWQDFVHVSRCTELPHLKDVGAAPTPEYNTRQRVWANVLDTCKHYNAQSFLLTTHEGWMFGKFSQNWEHVDVSPVIEYKAADPTIMQNLVYWVGMSMGLAGTSAMPHSIYYTAEVATAIAAITAERETTMDQLAGENVTEVESEESASIHPTSAGPVPPAAPPATASTSGNPPPPPPSAGPSNTLWTKVWPPMRTPASVASTSAAGTLPVNTTSTSSSSLPANTASTSNSSLPANTASTSNSSLPANTTSTSNSSLPPAAPAATTVEGLDPAPPAAVAPKTQHADPSVSDDSGLGHSTYEGD